MADDRRSDPTASAAAAGHGYRTPARPEGPTDSESAGYSLARDLYDALEHANAARLRELLAEDFRGELTPGLPYGWGTAPYVSADSMIREGWGRVAREFDVVAQPHHVLSTDGWIVANGRYIGTSRRTGRPLDAWFVHLWQFEGAHLVWLRQVTDTQAWADACTPQ